MKRLILVVGLLGAIFSANALEVNYVIKDENTKHAWVFYHNYWDSDNALLLPYNMPGYTFSLGVAAPNSSRYLPIKPDRPDTQIDSISYEFYVNCDYLRRLEIPSTVKQIGKVWFHMFYDQVIEVRRDRHETLLIRSSLDSIFVDPDNEVYDSRDSCNAIIKTSTNTLLVAGDHVKIPRSVTKIGAGALRERVLPTSIGYNIPDWIEEIGEEAYMYSREYMKNYYSKDYKDTLVIPASVKKIGRRAYYDSGFFHNVVIKGVIDTIPEEAFAWDLFSDYENMPWIRHYENGRAGESIKNVIIEGDVKCIAKGAFHYQELERLELLADVDSIGEFAFGIFSIDEPKGVVVCQSKIPPRCHETAFANWHTDEKSVLVVPDELIDLYKNAPVWNEFEVVGFASVDGVLKDQAPVVEVARYDIHGRKLAEPIKGINIIQYSNGTIKKVVER